MCERCCCSIRSWIVDRRGPCIEFGLVKSVLHTGLLYCVIYNRSGIQNCKIVIFASFVCTSMAIEVIQWAVVSTTPLVVADGLLWAPLSTFVMLGNPSSEENSLFSVLVVFFMERQSPVNVFVACCM